MTAIPSGRLSLLCTQAHGVRYGSLRSAVFWGLPFHVMPWAGPYPWGVTLPGIISLDVLPENGPGRRESSKGVTCEAEVQRMAAGRIIVRDGEGRLSGGLTTKLGGPSNTDRWRAVSDNRCELTAIAVRILIAWEKGEKALDLPGDVTLHARRIKH